MTAFSSKRIRQIVVGTLAMIGAAYLALMVFAAFAVDCTYQRLTSATSPDGERVAEIDHRQCESEPRPTLELRIAVVESDTHTSISLGPAITNQIGLTWRGNRWLIVSVPPAMDVFNRTLRDVEVEFHVVD